MIYNDHFYKSEMLILSLLQNKDYTVDGLLHVFASDESIQINAGALLTSLFFFIESHLISQYEKDNDIYYHMEPAGMTRLNTLKRRYEQTKNAIEGVLKHD